MLLFFVQNKITLPYLKLLLLLLLLLLFEHQTFAMSHTLHIRSRFD